ncbi:hypothetical protein [Psychroflexus torquis]|uniref:hypothetical protein n=1 Tax=Psychroflexus torquis TaxID=57029 RepID=UPI0000D53D3D|nr:hypothetical protein [Psychroflexus torquis]
MKKITFLLTLLVFAFGFSQSPSPTNTDNNGYVPTKGQAVSQSESIIFGDVNMLESASLGSCITENFETYNLPSGLAAILTDVSMLLL